MSDRLLSFDQASSTYDEIVENCESLKYTFKLSSLRRLTKKELEEKSTKEFKELYETLDRVFRQNEIIQSSYNWEN